MISLAFSQNNYHKQSPEILDNNECKNIALKKFENTDFLFKIQTFKTKKRPFLTHSKTKVCITDHGPEKQTNLEALLHPHQMQF